MPGYSVLRRARERGVEIVPFCNPYTRLLACEDWPRVALEDAAAYRALFKDEAPDVLVHCGGICDVEKCEADPDWARAINVHSVRALLGELPRETRLVYVSSDHVFGGGEAPFTERSKPSPISVYGRTRVEAESIVSERKDSLVIRFALGIGPSLDGKSGHLDWMRSRTERRLPITIVQDEARSAVWADDLGDRILDLALSEISGLRHIAASRAVSRVELADYLNRRYRIGASFSLARGAERPAPHLGRVRLQTIHIDELAEPLRSVVD
jgi:dTDP-4-dehydrorhamnose reductase